VCFAFLLPTLQYQNNAEEFETGDSLRKLDGSPLPQQKASHGDTRVRRLRTNTPAGMESSNWNK
jgi:hypothetical protein